MEKVIITIGYLVIAIEYIVYMLAPLMFLWFFYDEVIKPFLALFRKSKKP